MRDRQGRHTRHPLGAHYRGECATGELCLDRELFVVTNLDSDEKKKRPLGFGVSQMEHEMLAHLQH